MQNNFFSLPTPDQAALIKQAAQKLNMPEIIIEKDIWICWLLEKIFSLPIQMSFKGGTSLSKVFGLIKRFSEDCDITIDYRNFQPKLSFENITRSQLKKISDQLKDQLQFYISKTVFPFLKKEINQSFQKNLFDLTLSDDGEQLRFYYPSAINVNFLTAPHTEHYLKDHVFIEFGIRNSAEPCQEYLLETYLSGALDLNLGLPKTTVKTLSPIRTFFEKATLIHVECFRASTKQSIDRLSRHWYDVFMLTNSWVKAKAFSNFEILRNVVNHKKAFFNYSFVNYDDCLSGKFRLIPNPNYLMELEADYTEMINSGMFNETPPSFKNILKTISNLEINLNEKLNFSNKN